MLVETSPPRLSTTTRCYIYLHTNQILVGVKSNILCTGYLTPYTWIFYGNSNKQSKILPSFYQRTPIELLNENVF